MRYRLIISVSIAVASMDDVDVSLKSSNEHLYMHLSSLVYRISCCAVKEDGS